MPANMDKNPIPMLLHRDTTIMITIRYRESDSQTMGLWMRSRLNRRELRYPTLSPEKTTCQTVESITPAVMEGRYRMIATTVRGSMGIFARYHAMKKDRR